MICKYNLSRAEQARILQIPDLLQPMNAITRGFVDAKQVAPQNRLKLNELEPRVAGANHTHVHSWDLETTPPALLMSMCLALDVQTGLILTSLLEDLVIARVWPLATFGPTWSNHPFTYGRVMDLEILTLFRPYSVFFPPWVWFFRKPKTTP